MFKKTLIAAVLAGASTQLLAASFYLTVPALFQAGALPAIQQISVTLNSTTLPDGLAGEPYAGFNLNTVLQVTGDDQFRASGVRWSIASGSLPAGLTLNSTTGTLTGTPTSAGSSSFTARATYRTKSGDQSYEVVVGTISVALQSATPTPGYLGAPYSYDFKPLFSATGDPAYTASQVGFSAQSFLPAGLVMGADGVVSGTPTAVVSQSVTVSGTYKSKSVQKNYTFAVTSGISDKGSYRAWSDNTFAQSCQAYKNPTGTYSYAGATGTGVYRIAPGGQAPFDVTCDMTTDGGGWTLVSYAQDLPFKEWFTNSNAWRWTPTDFTLSLSNAQINAIRAVSTIARQSYVSLCNGTVTYQFPGESEYLYAYAFGFRFHTGVETSFGQQIYTPGSVTVPQDGCKGNGFENGTLETATIFEFENINLPVVNVYTLDNGDPGEKFGSPLTQNPVRFR